MKTFSVLLIQLLFITAFAFAGRVELTYDFGNPAIKQTGDYQLLQFSNTMSTALPGHPAMPYCKVNLMLPPGESAERIDIIFSDEVILNGYFKLYPQQIVRPVSEKVSGVIFKNEAVYSSNIVLPTDPKGALVTSFLNGHSFALSTFTPVRYNPVTGSVSYYKSARVIVTTRFDEKAQTAVANCVAGSNSAQALADNPEMESLYSASKSPLTGNYDLLIISTLTYKNSFQSLQANYLAEGLTSLVVTRDSITTTMSGMDVPEKIRNFIIQEYQNHGVKYVMLAGDDELIPHRGFYCSVQSSSVYTDQNIPADLYYSALDGNWNTDGDDFWGEPGEDDLLPEIAVARLPFSNADELQHMLDKSYRYQFTPVPGEFRNILMAGENLWSNPDTWGSDYLELLKGEKSDNGYTTNGIPEDYPFDHLYDETTYWTGQDLMNHLNQGRPMLNHSGHANESYVMKLGIEDITNTNFYSLNGLDHNYTIIYTHGCYCGAFDYSDCIAEKMVSISNFAAAFIGNSRYGWFNEGQTEGPSAHLHREYIDALYTDSLNRLGDAHKESKIATAAWVTAPGQWEPGALRWCFYDCNVLGDPAFAVYTDNPMAVTVTYPSTVLVGSASMNVSVSSGGNPVAGISFVALKDGLKIGKATTDLAGNAMIIFDVPVQNPGDAQLVVSGYNCKPEVFNFAFLAAAGPYVVYAGSTMNEVGGNQNNQPDYGETLLLTAGMRNSGGSDASNVMVTLSSTDEYVSISDNSELYTSIPAGDTVYIPDGFAFSVSEIVPDGHNIEFTLTAVAGNSWVSQFSVVCHAPELAAGGLVIDDANGGNGNGRLDPGEHVIFKIPAFNNGSSAALNTEAQVNTNSQWITFGNSTVQLGTLNAMSSAETQFEAEVSSDAPAASIVELNFDLTAGGYAASATYFPPIKLIVEDFETGNFDAFPWTKLGQNLWMISTESPAEGLFCGRSASISHGQRSELPITLNILSDDSISFYTKVSSEGIFDKLAFYIDIQKMQEWSGEVAWNRVSYPVSAGVHTFKWTYSKDMGTSSGNDAAWVDFIVFPAFVDYTGKPELVTGFEMSILPNPTRDKVKISAAIPGKNSATLNITDNLGKKVLTATLISVNNEGIFEYSGNISMLKPGLYSCTLSSGETNISKSFIVY